MPFRDLRAALAALEAQDLLFRVREPVDKDTELMPMVRWQYRGLPEARRRAFLFERVRGYDAPVVVGVLGGSRQVFAAAMECGVDEVLDRLAHGQAHPMEPVLVEPRTAPCKEVVLRGADLLGEGGGLLRLPIPISTPGFDPAPYLTSPYVVTKDPETGVRNVGTYRLMLKGPDRTGFFVHPEQHNGRHWLKWKERGQPMPAAVAIGTQPVIGMCSAAKLPYGLDEFAVAGGIQGQAVELVRCETVDLEVPACSEIVLEGLVTTDWMEPEAPFGEFSGYMGGRQLHPVFHISCITHRRQPIYQAFLSQYPPSESSKLREIMFSAIYLKALRQHVPATRDVAFHESGGSRAVIVVQLDRRTAAEPWQALHAANALDSQTGKVIVAVDADIDPRDADAVLWAIAYRMQPHLDVQILTGKSSMEDPSAAPPDAPQADFAYPPPRGASVMLIDATRKWAYPPVSLPARPFMERARALWERAGLPELEPRSPWFGTDLGWWGDESRTEAALAVEGRLREVWSRLADQGRRV